MGESQLVCGSIAACITALTLQPLDVLKTAILTGEDSRKIPSTMRFIYSQYGIKGYWRGVFPSLGRSFFAGGTFMYFLSTWKRILQVSPLKSQFLVDFLASGLTRTMNNTLYNPFSVLKVRMEAPQYTAYTSMYNGFVSILREEGIRGYYKGLLPSILRDAPYSGLSYGLYQYYQQLLQRLLGEQSTVNSMFVAALGACSATILTQPFDVLKVRLQYAYVDKAHLHDYTGLINGIFRIWREEGIGGLMKGMSIRLIERSLSYGLMWGLFLHFKAVLYPNK